MGMPTPAHADPNPPQATVALLSERIPGAERLEGRLLAPCCWNQTLDTHGSEIAYSLRREIRTRLKGGESPDKVEADLIARYGTRLRAVPDRVPLDTVALFGWVGLGVTGLGLAALLLRWRRRRALPAGAEAASPARDAFDDRLDAELRRLD
jgi:cytochrome c-type biogenesis protein CcmH